MAPKPKTRPKTTAKPQKASINPKTAVRLAYEYLMKTSPNSSRFSNFRLEEIKSNGRSYLITLSYEVAGEFGFDRQREFKDFSVKKDGTVLWMKIRKP